MPTATVTVRELHNTETGLDLSVPTYKETKGLLGSTVEFQVVAVSRLQVFKSPKHRESDVVQFTVLKKFAEFEELYRKLGEKFSGTVLPPLPKRALFVDDAVARERRSSLDRLLKLLACTSKLATSAPLLEFLGVRTLRASKQQEAELEEGSAHKQGETTQAAASPSTDRPSLFDDDDDKGDEGDELFGEAGEAEGDDAALFTDSASKPRSSAAADSVQLFGAQELEGDITEEDERAANLLVPDAILHSRASLPSQPDPAQDDLFQLDDDLDRLMTVPLGKAQKEAPPKEEEPHPPKPAKPTPAPRPRPPAKPASLAGEQGKGGKPAVAPRSKGLGGQSGGKPPVPTKPKPKSEEPPKGDNPPAELDTSDILQYIAENTATNDDLDLFS